MRWGSVKRFFVNLGVYLYCQLRIYKYWSKLYRLIWERKYRNCPLTQYQNFGELVKFTRTLIWTQDTWKEMFDAISTPNKVQWIGSYGDRKVGDCDEFAIYITNALAESKEAGVFDQGDLIKNTYLLTVCWSHDDKGKMGGHNVCLIEWTMNGGTYYSYMDYDFPSTVRKTIREVVGDVRFRYGGADEPMGYAIHDKDLNVVKVSWK